MLRPTCRLLFVFCLVVGVAAGLPPASVAQEVRGPAVTDATDEVSDGSVRSDVDLLVDILEDDAARAELLDRLRAAESGVAEGDRAAEEAPGLLSESAMSFGRRIALETQEAAEKLADRVVAAWAGIANAPRVLDGLRGFDAAVILDTFAELLLVILATGGIYSALRAIAKPHFRRMGESAAHESCSAGRRIHLYLVSGILDLLIVILAWGGGYVIATLALGETGQIAIRQTLYLNAFLAVGLVKVAARMVLSPTTAKFRLLPMGDRTARSLTGWITVVVGLVGYGQLVAVPIINAQATQAVGRAVSILIALTVLAISVGLVLAYRRRLADWLTGTQSSVSRTGTLYALARNWHWPVLLYLVGLCVVVLTQPPQLALQTLMTSGRVLLIVLGGIALSSLLTRVMHRGITLPEKMRLRLPLLEARLNRFVPRILFVARLLIVAFVILIALDAIALVDLQAGLSSEFGLELSGRVVSVALILLAAFVIFLALSSYVDYRLNPNFGAPPTPRETTLLTLLRNAGIIALTIVTAMFVLAEVGLNIAPLLASAGVLGLAIGFGAQKMVQDIITGIFIQFERAINVGDVVTVGGITGSVERLTIRSVSLRDLDGSFHIIPFSSVDAVSNFTREFSFYLVDMGVAYRESMDEVKTAMFDAFEELRAMPDHAVSILADLEWFGLNAFGDSAVVLRCRIKTVPGMQWSVGRAYNEILKRIFDERGIEIPFPHQTLYFGERKDGSTQTVNVNSVTETRAPSDAQRISPRRPPDTAEPTQDGPHEGEGRGGDPTGGDRRS